jgi:hypothetical protein
LFIFGQTELAERDWPEMGWRRTCHRAGIARVAAAMPRRPAEDLARGQQDRQCPRHWSGIDSAARGAAAAKFKGERPYADLAAAERKLLELANTMEADSGRLPVGALNTQFIEAGASVPEYIVAMKAAVEHGYFTMHP